MLHIPQLNCANQHRDTSLAAKTFSQCRIFNMADAELLATTQPVSMLMLVRITLLYCIARKAAVPTCLLLNIPGGMCHPSSHLVWAQLSALQSCLAGLQWQFFLYPLLLLKSSNGLI